MAVSETAKAGLSAGLDSTCTVDYDDCSERGFYGFVSALSTTGSLRTSGITSIFGTIGLGFGGGGIPRGTGFGAYGMPRAYGAVGALGPPRPAGAGGMPRAGLELIELFGRPKTILALETRFLLG